MVIYNCKSLYLKKKKNLNSSQILLLTTILKREREIKLTGNKQKKKKIIKIRMEINEEERKMSEKFNKTKSWFFGKIIKMTKIS